MRDLILLSFVLLVFYNSHGQQIVAETNQQGLSDDCLNCASIVGINNFSGLVSFGVIGIGHRGVKGLANGPFGYGVIGDATNDNITGAIGVYATARDGTGLYARSTSGYGIEGTSTTYHGARFRGKNSSGFADIRLEGGNWFDDNDDGVITSDPDAASSDLVLVANDAVIVSIDTDGGETGQFVVWDGKLETAVFEVQDDGDVFVNGSVVHSSDRQRKDQITSVDPMTILESISKLPVYEWQYKGQNKRHIGPMAQDFHLAFGLGDSDEVISAIDIDGVSLLGIQALHQKIVDQQVLLRYQETRITSLEAELSEIKALLKGQLESDKEE